MIVEITEGELEFIKDTLELCVDEFHATDELCYDWYPTSGAVEQLPQALTIVNSLLNEIYKERLSEDSSDR